MSSKKSKKRSTIDWKKVLNLAIAVVKLVTQIIILFITLRDLGLYKPYPLLLYSSITKKAKKTRKKELIRWKEKRKISGLLLE